MLQPYLIALLMSKGVPMLWQGEEFAENYFLPDVGAGRVSLLRPLRWDYFYDDAGQSIAGLVRKLLRVPRSRSRIRRGAYFFFNDWDRYQRLGLTLFARSEAARYTLVAVNTRDVEQTVPFWFPTAGDYVEELHGGSLDLRSIPALQQVMLTIPSHYGRIWTRVEA
jgi:1,4-alpha-glucan branching enzyme